MKTIEYTDNGGKRIIAYTDGNICGDSLIIAWNISQNSFENHRTAAELLAEHTTRKAPELSSKAEGEKVYNWEFS